MSRTESDVELPKYHPFDLVDGINRPGLDKNVFYTRVHQLKQSVIPLQRPNGVTAWFVPRYADVTYLLRDPRFSRSRAHDADMVPIGPSMLGLDGEEHARIRDIVRDWFTPNSIEGMGRKIAARAMAQASAMKEGHKGVDLLGWFALPFAFDVISDMLGLPPDDRQQFRLWAEPLLGTSSQEQALAGIQAMDAHLEALMQKRVREPQGDLLTEIAAKGAGLPREQRIWIPLALIAGGWETVTSSIGTFVEVLLTRPYGDYDTGYRYLVEHPDAIPGAVTELERLHSTAADDLMLRRVTEDVVLPSGAQMRADDLVLPSGDGANRDPRKFRDPETMDFDRNPNPHVSFGWGLHHCIGRHLGHSNVIVGLSTLIREFPGLHLTGPVPRKENHAVAGPRAVPVAWS